MAIHINSFKGLGEQEPRRSAALNPFWADDSHWAPNLLITDERPFLFSRSSNLGIGAA